jgi:hypothetical protein
MEKRDAWADNALSILGGVVWAVVMIGLGLAFLRLVAWGFTG